MQEQEGVIKFQLFYQAAPLPANIDITELNAWRTLCVQTGMLGQHPERYDNYGFGNISQRVAGGVHFIISGTQTGGKLQLSAADYALVTACQPALNRISAKGVTKPSSEAMTHGQLYQLLPQVNFIIHAHCPAIWQHADALALAQTAAQVPYGTVAMAEEVSRLFQQSEAAAQGIFTMAGHEDGVVTFGKNAETSFQILMRYYAAALALGATPNR